MSSSERYDEFTRKRQAEERKLIEEIRYKRSCIKLATTFPSEEDIQKTICRFVNSIVYIVSSNTLSEEFAEIRGSRSRLFASLDATLYKSRLQNVHLQVRNTLDRIQSAFEALSMAYEVYGLLVLSDESLAISRVCFYDKREQGVTLDPAFTSDFVRKEVDFLTELEHQIQSEIRDAGFQEESETHESAWNQVKELLITIYKDIGELKQKTISQDETIKSISERIDSLCIAKATREQEPDLDSRVRSEKEQNEHIKRERRASSEHENESLHDNEASETQGKEIEPEEDLELMDDNDLKLDNEPDSITTSIGPGAEKTHRLSRPLPKA
uniref:Translin n=1 Tax=Haemonchus contortus TaxID=6289 RepID=W6NC66_HAECO